MYRGCHPRRADTGTVALHSTPWTSQLRKIVQYGEPGRATELIQDVFERANRTITPSADAWHRSGDLLAEMARQESLAITGLSKAFANDVLLALSCREAGCVLVTDNEWDFQRIRRFIQFEFIKPWPGSQVHAGP